MGKVTVILESDTMTTSELEERAKEVLNPELFSPTDDEEEVKVIIVPSDE